MPNWEFEFHSPSHEGDLAIKLDDILKIGSVRLVC